MLLQAQGNGDSPAGLRLQRLCTELVSHVIPSAHTRSICTQEDSVGMQEFLPAIYEHCRC